MESERGKGFSIGCATMRKRAQEPIPSNNTHQWIWIYLVAAVAACASRSSSICPSSSFAASICTLYVAHKSFGKCTVEWKCHAITYENHLCVSILSTNCRKREPPNQQTHGAHSAHFHSAHVRLCIQSIHRPHHPTHTHTQSVIGGFFTLCRTIAFPMRN